jgi:hypothetical protein
MARAAEWKSEIEEYTRREGWSLRGPTRLIKVKDISEPDADSVTGFVGQEKVLLGKTPIEIREHLGMKRGSLQRGCSVYVLLRLPTSAEFRYELTAKYPDGWLYVPYMHNELYLPGTANVHQWNLLSAIPCSHLLDLRPGERYPYLHSP